MSRTDSWMTPAWLFEALDEEFHFDLDAAATAETTRCERWLDDCLAPRPWTGRSIWLNPPYRRDLLTRILSRAAEESRRPLLPPVIVSLLPVRTETDWWADTVIAFAREIRFLRRRVAFVPPSGHHIGNGFSNRPRYASALAIFGPGERAEAAPIATAMDGRPVRRADWRVGIDAKPQPSLFAEAPE